MIACLQPSAPAPAPAQQQPATGHEAAAELMIAYEALDTACIALEAALHAGRWATFRDGAEGARKARKNISRALFQQKRRLEALIHAAATTPAGTALVTYEPPRRVGRAALPGSRHGTREGGGR